MGLISNEINEEQEEQSKNSSRSTSNDEEKKRVKTRSVSFAPTVDEYEIPSRSSLIYENPSLNYLDALVESYKLETTNHFPSLFEEKKYSPRTNRTRSNREHRIRHLMNKLEELTLWDREEELKHSQAQFLREQKLEQIQDRQRNQNLCLQLMRQRHESELESAILLDRSSTNVNDELTRSSIEQAMNLSPLKFLKRRRQNDEETPKTPLGRFRNFETTMEKKIDKINDKFQPDREIMRQYYPFHPSILPQLNETFGKFSFNSQENCSNSDYEKHFQHNSNRDVRVPFKDEINDRDDDEENFNEKKILIKNSFSSLIPSTRDQSLIHSSLPLSTNNHLRTLNDDLNALTRSKIETKKSSKLFNSDRNDDEDDYQHSKYLYRHSKIKSEPMEMTRF